MYPKEKKQNSRNKRNSKVLVLTPVVDDKYEIIKHSIYQLVIMNLMKLHGNEKQRAMDFIFGAAYALDLQVVSVAPDIYLVAPKNIYIGEDNNV